MESRTNLEQGQELLQKAKNGLKDAGTDWEAINALFQQALDIGVEAVKSPALATEALELCMSAYLGKLELIIENKHPNAHQFAMDVTNEAIQFYKDVNQNTARRMKFYLLSASAACFYIAELARVNNEEALKDAVVAKYIEMTKQIIQDMRSNILMYPGHYTSDNDRVLLAQIKMQLAKVNLVLKQDAMVYMHDAIHYNGIRCNFDVDDFRRIGTLYQRMANWMQHDAYYKSLFTLASHYFLGDDPVDVMQLQAISDLYVKADDKDYMRNNMFLQFIRLSKATAGDKDLPGTKLKADLANSANPLFMSLYDPIVKKHEAIEKEEIHQSLEPVRQMRNDINQVITRAETVLGNVPAPLPRPAAPPAKSKKIFSFRELFRKDEDKHDKDTSRKPAKRK